MACSRSRDRSSPICHNSLQDEAHIGRLPIMVIVFRYTLLAPRGCLNSLASVSEAKYYVGRRYS